MNDKFIKSFANVCYAISGYISTNTRKKQHFYTYFSENETISIGGYTCYKPVTKAGIK